MSDRAANAAVVLIAVCLIALTAAHFSQGVAPEQTSNSVAAPIDPALWREMAAGANATGPDEAVVVLVEFGDFQCPACRSAVSQLKRLASQFPAELRVVYRHWPLSYHKEAYLAALVSECAAIQGKFWEMHDVLYDKQDSLGRIPWSQFGTSIVGLDTTTLGTCIGARATARVVDHDSAIARRTGATGTPALFVNGERVLRGNLDSMFIADIVTRSRRAGTDRR